MHLPSFVVDHHILFSLANHLGDFRYVLLKRYGRFPRLEMIVDLLLRLCKFPVQVINFGSKRLLIYTALNESNVEHVYLKTESITYS